MPWASPDRQGGRLAKSLDDAIGYGITTVVEPQNSLDGLALFERARAEGRLRSRIVAALFHPRGTGDADLDDFAATAERYADDRLRAGPLKLYMDDVAEPRTAALLEPYAGCGRHRGGTFYPAEEFAELLAKLDARLPVLRARHGRPGHPYRPGRRDPRALRAWAARGPPPGRAR
ncbi:amidohydrolase family protein [Streptomyces sp. G44]|uniref:amidohydrolase family protein n=1 Tax=Streptomyces sp. G44 TaxID=2807632 RepID=UPI0027DC8393|nr:amidohydrolase family protein [Streptomyces sp. G44]